MHTTDERSALLVAAPEADRVIAPFRGTLDPGAALGVPAHITILYPFMPPADVWPDVASELRALFAAIDAFEISLRSIGWFGRQVVYLRPEPDAVLREMTRRVVERWPQWLPYGGAHREPTPHVTIGDTAESRAMVEAAEAVRPFLPLPVAVSGVELWAGSDQPGSWHHRLTFPLRPPPQAPGPAAS